MAKELPIEGSTRMIGWGLATLDQDCTVWSPGDTINLSALARRCARDLGMEQGRELTTLLGKFYGEEVASATRP